MPAGEILARALLYAGLIYVMASIGECNQCTQRKTERIYYQPNSQNSLVEPERARSGLDSSLEKQKPF